MTTIQDKAQARAQLFQLMALGMGHPLVEFHRVLVNGSYPLALSRAAYTACGIDTVFGQFQNQFEDFEASYIQLFQIGKQGRPMVSLNAGDYKELLGSGSRPEFLLEYSAWYRHFGLTTSEDDQANELADHITCQFELLAWLSHLEHSSADKPELQIGYQCAQRDFCQRHLLNFLELLVTALKQSDHDSFTQRFSLNLSALSLEAVSTLHNDFTRAHGESIEEVITTDQIASVNLWG